MAVYLQKIAAKYYIKGGVGVATAFVINGQPSHSLGPRLRIWGCAKLTD